MQDKFYNIEPAVDTKETGNGYPAAKIVNGYSFSAPDSVHRINNYSVPDFTPNISFELSKGAKLCDVMTEAAMPVFGLLVSKKFKVFLQKFNLGNHIFLKGSIQAGFQVYEYYWFYLLWDARPNNINFNDSSFYKKKYDDNLGGLSIFSIEDFKRIKKEIGPRYSIGFNPLVLLKDPELDLWPIPFKGDIIVSSNLKQEIESSEFTGICFSEISYLRSPLQT